MALINDPRAFTGGAVVVDSSQPVNLYAQLSARKQAKDEALNQFFDKELRDANDLKGVRAVHRPTIFNEVEKAKQYFRENKEKVMKGGMERDEFDKIISNAKYLTQKAKDRDKLFFELGKARVEGKIDFDDEDLVTLDKISRSVGDKDTYKEDGVSDYSYMDFSGAAKDFDEKKFKDLVMGGRKPSKVLGQLGEYNEITGKRPQDWEMKYDPETVKQIATQGALVFSDKKNLSERRYANRILKDPESEDYKILNEAYQKLNPPKQTVRPDRTIVIEQDIMDTHAKVGAALAIVNSSGSFGKGVDEVVDVKEQDKRRKALSAYNSSLIASRGGGSGGGNVVGGNQFDTVDLSKYGNPFEGQIQITKEDLPEGIKSVLKSGGYDLTKDKFFEIELNGGKLQTIRPIGNGKDRKGVITRSDMENAQLKYNTEAKKGQQPTFGEKPPPKANLKPDAPKEKFPLPKGKPATVKQNGVTYTWNSKTGQYE